MPRTPGRSSPGLWPLQSLSASTLGSSNPPEHEARTRALARRPELATPGTVSPSRRVRPPCRRTTSSSLVGSTQRLTAGPRHLSAATPSLTALGHPPQRTHTSSQGFAVDRDVDLLREEGPLSWGFLPPRRPRDRERLVNPGLSFHPRVEHPSPDTALWFGLTRPPTGAPRRRRFGLSAGTVPRLTGRRIPTRADRIQPLPASAPPPAVEGFTPVLNTGRYSLRPRISDVESLGKAFFVPSQKNLAAWAGHPNRARPSRRASSADPPVANAQPETCAGLHDFRDGHDLRAQATTPRGPRHTRHSRSACAP